MYWRGSNLYDPHTSVDHDAGVGTTLRCWPPKKLSPAVAVVVVIGLNKEHVEWAKYSSNSASACVGRHGITLLQTGHISRPFKWPSWDNYRRSALFVERTACWPVMCVRSVLASNARVRHAFMHDIVPSLGDVISQGRWIRDRYRNKNKVHTDCIMCRLFYVIM